MSKEIKNEIRENPMVFETLAVGKEGAVLFVEISAPPMNLLGPELVRDLVSLIHEDLRRDSDLFGEAMSKAEAQSQIQAALKGGFQTSDAEMNLAHLLGES